MSNINIVSGVQQVLANLNGKWSEKKGLWSFSATIAERKVFMSKKTLTYMAKMRVDEKAMTLKFSEMFLETQTGLSSMDDNFSSTFLKRPTIEDQLKNFGKQYAIVFDHTDTMQKLKLAVEKEGYKLEYQILPVK